MYRLTVISTTALKALVALLAFAPFAASADSGFYIGASAGSATIETDLSGAPIPGLPSSIDEDDTAFKVFAGYNLDLLAIDLAVEGGYVDFGGPDVDVLGERLLLDATGINLWGIAAIGAGPVDLFAKLGYISWDVEAQFLGETASDDGNDIGYGVGLRFGLGPIQIRGEYELYDVEDSDVSMLSVGIAYQFD